ncbi:MAG: excinuclease [Lachnospiraceae bacterium]|nr:excinuclease [Lachnospiraceae bacterium]
MSDSAEIWGIETNNLKCIDIKLEKHGINLIIGPSGSGKSSLAYDTIAQIGQHEFMTMFADNVSEPTYRIKGYNNMVAAVPIKQSNYNNNTRSTIGTYFGINRNIVLIYAACLGLTEDFFVLNKEANLCENCHGIGTIKVLDENKIINYDVPLEKNPFKCWNRYKDYYCEIIKQYCADNDIDAHKTFRELSKHEKDLILFGESEKKYSIRYKKNNAFSRRTSKFYGVMTSTPMMTNFSIGNQYYSSQICPCCEGKKYAPFYEDYKLEGLSIGDFMTTPFDQLIVYINRIKTKAANLGLSFALNSIRCFVEKAIELNLGHLFFHRAIPTLSGGELQRLRMVQVFNTQLSDLMIVLDEPLAGLSGTERQSIFKNIVDMSGKHTIIIVDHSDIFVPVAKNIIALGERGGNNGGYLINANAYLQTQREVKKFNVVVPSKSIHVKIDNQIYQYSGVDIEIGYECMNLVSGASGIGKSTLLREYFPQFFEHYAYINQKALVGNKTSSVSTALDIFNKIIEEYATAHNKDKHFFSNQPGCDGCCPVCGGAGYIEFGSDQDSKTRLECRDCDGTGFNKRLHKFKLNGKSIFDIWNMTLDEGIEFFHPINKKISDSLNDASSIMLGHLRLGQPVGTLSGGENIRIKILKSVRSTAKVLGIDEPFKGLSNSEIYCVALYLEHLRASEKTIIVVDHTEAAIPYFAKHIILRNRNSLLSE